MFQNSLDTVQLEDSLLEDKVPRALEQPEGDEEEFSLLDSKQSSKRTELKECEKELTASKKRVGEAKGELKELTQKETTLAKKSTDLLVSINSSTTLS